ncbi:MAG TPA: hypothetical protein PLV68_09150, partial [Ilumatobacteraceae bacterium]|nr:hypothetical protein [Ilumatobacteraceae bacterium]
MLQREGGGEWGGWVLKVRVEGTAGSVEVSGWDLRSKLGLKSSWFAVRGSADNSTGGSGGGGSGGGSGSDPRCGLRVPPPVTSSGVDDRASLFTPITPRRLIDTRIGFGTAQAPIGVGCTVQIDPGVPDDTTAVVINVTTVDPDLNGYLTAYPCGTAMPLASIVPALTGRIVPGSAIVPVGADGTVCIYSMRATELVVDLTGYYRASEGVGFEPLVTERRFDSRNGARLANGATVRVQVGGIGNVPGHGARQRCEHQRVHHGLAVQRRTPDHLGAQHRTWSGGGQPRASRSRRLRRGVHVRAACDAPGPRRQRLVRAYRRRQLSRPEPGPCARFARGLRRDRSLLGRPEPRPHHGG